MTSSKGNIFPVAGRLCRSPVTSPHKRQWDGALVFSLICEWINGCENNREAWDLRRHLTHYDVAVMLIWGYRQQPSSRQISSRTEAITEILELSWRQICRQLCRQHQQLAVWHLSVFSGCIISINHFNKKWMPFRRRHFQVSFLMKRFEFRLRFHWRLFLSIQLTICRYWFR